MTKNANLHKAKAAKSDEFYTQLLDIESELQHYESHFRGKIVYSNCDAEWSNFVKYFKDNKERLGIKEFIYSSDDFRSAVNKQLMAKADIVVTNPPFSLFREYIAQLIEYKKDFLVVGNMNGAASDKNIFSLILKNKLWMGYNFNISMVYKSPYKNTLDANRKFVKGKGYDPDYHIKVPAIAWFTNLSHSKRKVDLDLYKKYNPIDYPFYDNYKIINVDKVTEIPEDWADIMGVPITFLGKWNPNQFDLLGMCNDGYYRGDTECYAIINGKKKYARLLIKKK